VPFATSGGGKQMARFFGRTGLVLGAKRRE